MPFYNFEFSKFIKMNHIHIRKNRLITYILCLVIMFGSFIFYAAGPIGVVRAAEDTATPSDAEKGDKKKEIKKVDPPKVKAASAIVMDIDAGKILFEKDSHQKHYPASIAKLMTAFIAVEKGDLKSTVTMSNNAVDKTPSDSMNLALTYGEQLTLKDALYGMLLSSANEAAYAVAEHVGGDLNSFCGMMNDKASSLGCENTHFSNASGLHDKDTYTTAYDMALICSAAYSFPDFKNILSTPTYTIPATNKNTERVLWNGDDMIFESSEYYYPYAVCGKTGYTPEANATLVTYAEKNDRRLVCVLMDVPTTSEAYEDTTNLLNYCFDNFHIFKPLENFSFDKIEIDSPLLNNYYTSLNHKLPNLSTDKEYTVYAGTHITADNIDKKVIIYDNPDSKIAGKIELSYEGENYGEVDIINNDYTDNSSKAVTEIINKTKKSGFTFHWYYVIMLAIAVIMVILLIEIHKLQQRRLDRKNIHSYPLIRHAAPKKSSNNNKEKSAADPENASAGSNEKNVADPENTSAGSDEKNATDSENVSNVSKKQNVAVSGNMSAGNKKKKTGKTSNNSSEKNTGKKSNPLTDGISIKKNNK